MISIFRAAVSGMLASRNWIDILGQNLSNVNTPGFKHSRAELQDLAYRDVPNTQPGPGVALRVGSGADLIATQRTFFQGPIRDTDSATDLAIQGDGFFPVSMPDGTTAYTRNGSFHVDAAGNLVTPAGERLAADIVLPPRFDHLRVTDTGQVFVDTPDSTEAVLVGQVVLARFANPNGLIATGSGLLRPTGASGPPELGTPGAPTFGQVLAGKLEESTVSLADEMTQLILAQRSYQLNTRALMTLDQMIGRVTELRR